MPNSFLYTVEGTSSFGHGKQKDPHRSSMLIATRMLLKRAWGKNVSTTLNSETSKRTGALTVSGKITPSFNGKNKSGVAYRENGSKSYIVDLRGSCTVAGQ